MLHAVAEGKAISVADAHALADAVLHTDELSRAALAVGQAENRLVLRRLVELCALVLERAKASAREEGADAS